MPNKGYKQTEEHRKKHLDKIVGQYNGNWNKSQRKTRDKRNRTIEDRRRTHLKTTYGLTLEDYEEMLSKQDGKCAICQVSQDISIDRRGRVKSTLYIDHCHKTGKVRGLLCSLCNNGLGNFRDSDELLNKAVEYLKK